MEERMGSDDEGAAPNPSDVVVVMMTTPSTMDAEKFAKILVREELVKCVNITPGIRSVYRWEGELCADDERLCFFKLPRAGLEKMRARAIELHPADVPEFLVLDVTDGHAPYLRWVLGR